MVTIGNPNDFNKGDKIRYFYRGYGPNWFGSLYGEVLKINKKSIKVKLFRPSTKEYLIYNINPIELAKQ